MNSILPFEITPAAPSQGENSSRIQKDDGPSFDKTFQEVNRSERAVRREEKVDHKEEANQGRRLDQPDSERKEEAPRAAQDEAKKEGEQPRETDQPSPDQEKPSADKAKPATQQEASEPAAEEAVESSVPANDPAQSEAANQLVQSGIAQVAAQPGVPDPANLTLQGTTEGTQTSQQTTNLSFTDLAGLQTAAQPSAAANGDGANQTAAGQVNAALPLTGEATEAAQAAGNSGNVKATQSQDLTQTAQENLQKQTEIQNGDKAAKENQALDLKALKSKPAETAPVNETGKTASAATQGNTERLEQALLQQIKTGVSNKETDTRILLKPTSLGELMIQPYKDGETQGVRIVASNPQVQQALEGKASQVKNLFTNLGITAEQIDVPKVKAGPMENLNLSQGDLGSFKKEAGNFETRTTQETNRIEATASKALQAIGARHGIRDLHSHILDQIRMKVSGGRNEVQIRLFPPELGEIKVQMAMEDKTLSVRMEVSDPMVKTLLERDIQQLKNTLAEAGIDVGKFDLNSGEESSKGKQAGQSGQSLQQGKTNELEEDKIENDWARSQETVKNETDPGSVDYLVY